MNYDKPKYKCDICVTLKLRGIRIWEDITKEEAIELSKEFGMNSVKYYNKEVENQVESAYVNVFEVEDDGNLHFIDHSVLVDNHDK